MKQFGLLAKTTEYHIIYKKLKQNAKTREVNSMWWTSILMISWNVSTFPNCSNEAFTFNLKYIELNATEIVDVQIDYALW